MRIGTDTYGNWEKGKTEPVAAQFWPVVDFLGYDPTPAPKSLVERLQGKRRLLGATFAQVAMYLGWDPGTLTQYLNGTWRMSPARAAKLEAFLSAERAELGAVLSLPRGAKWHLEVGMQNARLPSQVRGVPCVLR